MDFWTAVVLIVAIGCFTAMRLRNQERPGLKGKFGKAGRAAYPDDVEQEVQALRERIAVLERIATDDRRGTDLAREIDALRERQG